MIYNNVTPEPYANSSLYRVAVYGSLRAGCGNHKLLSRSKYLGEYKIKGYTMYSLGAFPFITKSSSPKSEITVELYEVDAITRAGIDVLEGYTGNPYTSFYNRETIEIEGKSAYIYTFEKSALFRDKVVGSGDWVKFKRSRINNRSKNYFKEKLK